MVTQEPNTKLSAENKYTSSQLGPGHDQLEFKIEELASRLPPGTQTAACRGCKGCKSSED